MAQAKDVGPGKEFFSEWHKERYIEDCERDVEAQKNRVAELEALGEDGPAFEQAKEALANAKVALERVKPKAKAKK